MDDSSPHGNITETGRRDATARNAQRVMGIEVFFTRRLFGSGVWRLPWSVIVMPAVVPRSG